MAGIDRRIPAAAIEVAAGMRAFSVGISAATAGSDIGQSARPSGVAHRSSHASMMGRPDQAPVTVLTLPDPCAAPVTFRGRRGLVRG